MLRRYASSFSKSVIEFGGVRYSRSTSCMRKLAVSASGESPLDGKLHARGVSEDDLGRTHSLAKEGVDDNDVRKMEMPW